MLRECLSVSAVVAVAACTTPDLSGELGSFSGSVSEVSSQYKSDLGLNGTETIRADERAALIADRNKLILLTNACQGVAGRIPGQTVDECQIDREDAQPASISKARALNQINFLAGYVEALSLLAEADTPAKIDTASAALVDAVGALNGESGGGLVSLAKTLEDNKDAIGDTLNFAAEQYRYRTLRRVVDDADPAVERIVLNLVDVARANGLPSSESAFRKLRDAQNEMDRLKREGSAAEYGAAIDAFYSEYDAYRAVISTGVVPQIYRISTTHKALRDRLQSPGDIDDIEALLKQLKDLHGAFQEEDEEEGT